MYGIQLDYKLFKVELKRGDESRNYIRNYVIQCLTFTDDQAMDWSNIVTNVMISNIIIVMIYIYTYSPIILRNLHVKFGLILIRKQKTCREKKYRTGSVLFFRPGLFSFR